MKEHRAAYYKTEAKSHDSGHSWKECKLQTYFAAKGRIDYFVVVDTEKGRARGTARGSPLLTEPEKELFMRLEKDYRDVKEDIGEQAGIVHDFGDFKSERVPWLERLTFPSHLVTLKGRGDLELV
jgi:hypothetical protein